VGLRIAGRRTGASAFAGPMADTRLHSLPRRLRLKTAFYNSRAGRLLGRSVKYSYREFCGTTLG
jgi:hypothetical protein